MMVGVALAFLVAIAPAPHAVLPNRAADIAALREAKLRAWPALYRTNDADGLMAFLADGFVALSDDGSTQTKEQAVAWVRANKWMNAENNFRYDISDIAFYGTDTANVYGVGSFNGTGSDGACRMRYTSANIFVRQGTRWRPAFSHTSKAACVPGGSA
jgi:ketosteroid isomerase-like protein